jgi:hypothetical protein
MSLSEEARKWITIFLQIDSQTYDGRKALITIILNDHPGLMRPACPWADESSRLAVPSDLGRKNLLFYIIYTTIGHPREDEIVDFCIGLTMNDVPGYRNFFELLLAEN